MLWQAQVVALRRIRDVRGKRSIQRTVFVRLRLFRAAYQQAFILRLPRRAFVLAGNAAQVVTAQAVTVGKPSRFRSFLGGVKISRSAAAAR